MRWDDLFRDLEAQLDAADRADLAAEVADRTRRELARVRLVDRLRAAVGAQLTVTVLGGSSVSGSLLDVGPDWLLVAEGAARQALVPSAAVLGVAGLPRRAAAPGSEGSVAARLTLGFALRGVARDRSAVALLLVSGDLLHGTIDSVGADFVDLSHHSVGEPRRRGDLIGARAVPVSAIAVVRSD